MKCLSRITHHVSNDRYNYLLIEINIDTRWRIYKLVYGIIRIIKIPWIWRRTRTADYSGGQEAEWKKQFGKISTRQKEKWDTHERHNGSYKSSVRVGQWPLSVYYPLLDGCFERTSSSSSNDVLFYAPISRSACLTFCLSTSLSGFSASRSTVRRLLRRISHDCPTVILSDP